MDLALLTLASTSMAEKLGLLVPEIILFVGASVVMMFGLSPSTAARKACVPLSGLALIAAGVAAALGPALEGHPFPDLMIYAKVLTAIVGVMVILLLSGTVDRGLERVFARSGFSAIRTTRGEFYAFFLFSMCGLMLTASADDLIWLFLALELTSLPTYVMVSISTARTRSQEAGVKYFFLGAFGAAIFLYGFAFLYGVAGTTQLWGDGSIAAVLLERAAAGEGLGTMATIGFSLAVVGLCFKIAAVPMHFYTADVYEGAASGVSAMLAFVPKAAGVLALIAVLSAAGWHFSGDQFIGAEEYAQLPSPIHELLWVIAAVTMLAGNVLALLQHSVKRMLAYSSVGHSGYLLVGIIAGPASPGEGLAANGIGATAFYLLCYGVMNLGAFGVLSCIERSGEEIETLDDLRGLCATKPAMGYAMVLSSLSLLGLPPLLGFWGKLYLFTAGVSAGEIALVVLLGVTSAIGALYYLRLAAGPFLEAATDREREFTSTASFPRAVATLVSAGGVVALVPFVSVLMAQAHVAAGGVIIETGADAAAIAAPVGAGEGSASRDPALPEDANGRARAFIDR